MAGTYFDLAAGAAENEREHLVRRSFSYFMDYVRSSRSDLVLLEQSLAVLSTNYEGRFPFLEDEIREARRISLQ